MSCGPDQLPIVTALNSTSCACVTDPRQSRWFDATNADLSATGWPVGDVEATSWSQAGRAASGYCASLNYLGGALNGWQSASTKGSVCYGAGAQWFDTTQAQRNTSAWSFSDVNTVGWAQASRVASDLCVQRGFLGGQFTGHQTGTGLMGLVCYALRAQWFDVPKADLSAMSMPIGDVNAVGWAYAARAADRWCVAPGRGFVGGRFNGWQSGTALGVVCYR
jgi:hypothetical protein